MRDAGTEYAEATFTYPMGTSMKALETNAPVFRGRGHVQSHISSNPTIDLWRDVVQKVN